MWSKLDLLELFTTHTSDVDRKISEVKNTVSVSVEQVRFIGETGSECECGAS